MPKRKKEKRSLTFYRVAFGLTPAFRVLVHPEVIRQCIGQQINLREQLPKVLGEAAVPSTTKCIIHYLRASEEMDHLGSAVMARKFNMVSCSHQKVKKLAEDQDTDDTKPQDVPQESDPTQIVSPDACISDILGNASCVFIK